MNIQNIYLSMYIFLCVYTHINLKHKGVFNKLNNKKFY